MTDDSTSLPCFAVLGGTMSGKQLVLEEAVDNILIGSDPSCRFHLDLPGVSPVHARIWIDTEGATVYDTNSPRGLYVNDDRVNGKAPLNNGDVLWLGTPGEEDVVMIQCRLPPRGEAPAASTDAQALPSEEETFAIGTPALSRHAKPEDFMVEPEPERKPPTADEFLIDTAPAPLPEAEATTVFAAADISFEDPVKFPVDLPAAPPAPPFFEDETETPPMTYAPQPMEQEPAPVAASGAPTPFFPSEPTPAPVETPRRPPAPTPPVAAAPAPRPPAVKQEKPRPAPAPVKPYVALEAPRAPRSPAMLAGLGVAGMIVVLGGGFVAYRYLRPPQDGAPTPAPVATLAAPPVETPAVETAQATPPDVAAPVPPPLEEQVTIVKAPTPKPSLPATTTSPSPTPRPTPSVKASAAPPRVEQPSADAVRAQQTAAQVATLLGQAEAAAAGHRYDAAVASYDEVLKLEPQNAKAVQGRAAASAAQAVTRRSFVSGKTVVETAKASKGDIAGFDSSDVKVAKAPDFLGRIEFQMSPASVKPGDSYALKVLVVNEGKKAIKISGLTVTTKLNGAPEGGPTSALTKEIEPQQRGVVAELRGTWKDGVTSWLTEAVVSAGKGDALRNQVTWK